MEVSEAQREYLKSVEQALKRRDFTGVISTIYHVISDSDIASGREPLDEGWGDVWNKSRRYSEHRVPKHVIDEISQAMAKIKRVDEALWDVRLSEDESLTILLGAGASKPDPSNIPVVAEFLPELWRRAKKTRQR